MSCTGEVGTGATVLLKRLAAVLTKRVPLEVQQGHGQHELARLSTAIAARKECSMYNIL